MLQHCTTHRARVNCRLDKAWQWLDTGGQTAPGTTGGSRYVFVQPGTVTSELAFPVSPGLDSTHRVLAGTGKIFLKLWSPSPLLTLFHCPQPRLCPPVCEESADSTTGQYLQTVNRGAHVRPHSAVFCGLGRLVSCLLPPSPIRMASLKAVSWSVWRCGAGPDLGVGVAIGSQRPKEKAGSRDWWGRQVLRGWEQLGWWERKMGYRTDSWGWEWGGEKPRGG